MGSERSHAWQPSPRRTSASQAARARSAIRGAAQNSSPPLAHWSPSAELSLPPRDATGAVKTTTFDAPGRVVSLAYTDGKRVTFQHDAGGRRTTMVGLRWVRRPVPPHL
ncbi:MAG: hypothetical protein FJX72_02300 [Armatimonadetes bacterium]|nr:hypothetical protein [Armatimonadota bacterium]